MNDFKLSLAAEKVLSRLNENGFKAYVVGGAIRNFYMNKEPSDYDIATSALPDEIICIFSDCKVIETGKHFGTITAIVDGEQIEITTFRSDGAYLNCRSPEAVYYSDTVEEDLKRRDFTINALAYSPYLGSVDLFGGISDIENKIIRTIGNPDRRFSEDALRILRGLRFSSILRFTIEEETKNSIFKNKNLLLNISKERIREEFNKILMGKNAKNVLLEYRDVISVFIPEIKDSEDNFYKASNDLYMNLALFLKDTFPNTRQILRRLKYDNKTVKTVCFLTEYYSVPLPDKKPELKKFLNNFGIENTIKLLDLKSINSKEEFQITEKHLYEIEENKECYLIKDLEINGNDLIDMGIEPKNIGKIMEFILNEVIYERIENKRDSLLESVKNNYSN